MTNTRVGDLDPVVAEVNAAVGQVEGRIGVACSGGADSMALLHATISVAGAARVVAITIDHGLVAGSAAVAERVAAWAIGQGAAAVVRRVEVAPRASMEAAARDARYAALADVAEERGLSVIFVGHTARDQVETVLMRIVRGTGPAGLAGIPRARALDHVAIASPVRRSIASPANAGRAAPPEAVRRWIVRPLLAVARDAIEAYVARHALPAWDDPMNADRGLARVRVREELVPALRRENPAIDAALVRLAESAAEWTEVIDALAAPFARFPLDCVELALQRAAVRKRAVALALEIEGIDYEAVHLDAIDALVLRASAGQVTVDLPATTLARTYDALDLVRARPASALAPPDGPFELRPWRAGDRMRPARLKGRSRKLSDLYIDAKIPRDQRAGARVLVRTTDLTIVWAEHLGLGHGEPENLVPQPVAQPPK